MDKVPEYGCPSIELCLSVVARLGKDDIFSLHQPFNDQEEEDGPE